MSRLNPEQRLFIDGALVGAEGGQTYNVINPATEEVAGIAAAASLADADRALAAARRCFDQSDWPTNKTRRLKALMQFRDGLKAAAEEWRHQIVAESGCPVSLTYGPMLDSSVAEIDYTLKLLENYQFEHEIEDMGSMGGPARRLVCKEAGGVVVAITPWNAPVQTNLQKIVPALAAGCTVVLKAAHQTPWSATTSAELIAALDKAVAQAREALQKTTNAHLETPWRLLASGHLAFEQPRHHVIRDTFLHSAHHRGQMTVYLRLLGSKVPSVYGPTADDQSFG